MSIFAHICKRDYDLFLDKTVFSFSFKIPLNSTMLTIQPTDHPTNELNLIIIIIEWYVEHLQTCKSSQPIE